MAQLLRTLRLRDLVLLIIGSVIGSGIFLVPGPILRQVNQSVGIASLVWIAGGVLSLLGALSYGELAAMRPEAGGLYVYIREGFGPLPAFLYGWAMFLAVASGTIASLAVAWLLPQESILSLTPVLRFIVGAAVAFAPIWCANLVFAQRFRDVPSSTVAFGANLLGAMLGGAIEYVALISGYRFLLVIVAVLYGLAFLIASARGRHVTAAG